MKYYLALKRNLVTCYNMGESWGCYAKWNKPITKKINTVWFHVCEVASWGTRGWWAGQKVRALLNEYRVSDLQAEKVLEICFTTMKNLTLLNWTLKNGQDSTFYIIYFLLWCVKDVKKKNTWEHLQIYLSEFSLLKLLTCHFYRIVFQARSSHAKTGLLITSFYPTYSFPSVFPLLYTAAPFAELFGPKIRVVFDFFLSLTLHI